MVAVSWSPCMKINEDPPRQENSTTIQANSNYVQEIPVPRSARLTSPQTNSRRKLLPGSGRTILLYRSRLINVFSEFSGSRYNQFLPGIRDREMNHQRAPPSLTNRRLCRWNKRLAAQRGYVTTGRSPECRCGQMACYPSEGFPKTKTIKLGTRSSSSGCRFR